MATQIRIQWTAGVLSFEAPSGVQQNDMVFWHNYDSEPHFPIPFCSGLKVAPGATSAPFRPTPQPAFPVTIQYGCALHDGELTPWTLVVNDNVPPTTPTGTNGTGAPIVIAIGAGGVFAEANVSQPDSVVWRNDDTQTHFPVPNCSGLLMKPGKSSNAMQPAVNPNVPMTILYGCAIQGHETEQGTINIYNPFVAVTAAVALSATAPSVPIATGGKSPYTLRPDATFAGISLIETTPAGSSTGVTIVLGTTPPTPPGPINYALDVTDAAGTTIRQTIPITIS